MLLSHLCWRFDPCQWIGPSAPKSFPTTYTHAMPEKRFKKLPVHSQVFPVYPQTRPIGSSSGHQRQGISLFSSSPSHHACTYTHTHTHTHTHMQTHTRKHTEAKGKLFSASTIKSFVFNSPILLCNLHIQFQNS